MKRYLLCLLCLLCLPCPALAGSLSATYTDNNMTVVGLGTSQLQIEALRTVKFVYTPSSSETGTFLITMTLGDDTLTSEVMTLSDGKYTYSRAFYTSHIGETVNIDIDASGFSPITASIVKQGEAEDTFPLYLDPDAISMKPNESNRFLYILGANDNPLNYDIEVEVRPYSMASAAYSRSANASRITVSAGSSEGEATLYVRFTNRTTGAISTRTCAITIDEDSTEGRGGGGGCNSGFAGLGLLLVLGAVRKGWKKSRK